MPLYTVRLRINVPGLGERIVEFPDINALSIESAVVQAKTSVIIEPIAVTKTA